MATDTVVVESSDTQLIVNEPDKSVVLTCGSQGPPGPPGSSQDAIDELDNRSYTQLIGNGSDTVIIVTHSIGKQHVLTQVFDATSHNEVAYSDLQNTSATTITLTFSSAPTTDQYRVIIQA